MDEAALRRLRLAIVVEDGDEEELQLHGVLRMLGAERPGEGAILDDRGASHASARIPRPMPRA